MRNAWILGPRFDEPAPLIGAGPDQRSLPKQMLVVFELFRYLRSRGLTTVPVDALARAVDEDPGFLGPTKVRASHILKYYASRFAAMGLLSRATVEIAGSISIEDGRFIDGEPGEAEAMP